MELGSKGAAADMLVMTATPIPRSLALASYGDMDVSILDEKPPGRKPIKTVLVSDSRLDEVIGHLSRALSEGRQAYWVCPLVEESELVDYTSAEARFTSLRAALGDVVGLSMGRWRPPTKTLRWRGLWLGNQGSGGDDSDRGGRERAQCLDHGG